MLKMLHKVPQKCVQLTNSCANFASLVSKRRLLNVLGWGSGGWRNNGLWVEANTMRPKGQRISWLGLGTHVMPLPQAIAVPSGEPNADGRAARHAMFSSPELNRDDQIGLRQTDTPARTTYPAVLGRHQGRQADAPAVYELQPRSLVSQAHLPVLPLDRHRVD